ncbi:MAG: hypothetical protein ACT4P6_09155 [Gemmatimonadaceae bacterium]
MDLRLRKGLTFGELIFLIVVVVAIGLAILAIFSICQGVNAAKIDVVKVEIAAVDPVDRDLDVDGPAKDYSVTVELERELDTDTEQLQVQIFEDDFFGNALLDENVRVFIRRGEKSGTGTFKLECDSNGGNVRIRGEDGSNSYDNPATIFGVVKATGVVLEGVSAENFAVRCRANLTDG